MTLDADDPLDDDDVAVLNALRTMYSTTDPAPDMLARVLFALDLDWIDAELATLTEDLVGSMGTRGAEGARTITFESSSLRVTIALPGGGSTYLDGWIEPAGILRIELVTLEARRETRSDEGGRFAFDSIPAGQVHLEVHPTPGSSVHLSRRVVTPRLVL